MSSIGHMRLSLFLAQLQQYPDGVEVAVSGASVADLKATLDVSSIGITVMNTMDNLGGLSGEPSVSRFACEMVSEVCKDKPVELYVRFRSERED
jgi:hypothetical protein